MSDFDVARIVPSTRDFAGAVRMQRKGLALVPTVEGDIASSVRRLDTLEVRAIAIREPGAPCMEAAKSTDATPLILLAPAGDTEACQRARFFGADCVVLAADHFAAHHKTVQSMRMMPAALVASEEALRTALEAGAKVIVLAGDVEEVCSLAADVEKRVTLIADLPAVDAEALRRLNGHVDAAIVPTSVHEAEGFEDLLDELD